MTTSASTSKTVLDYARPLSGESPVTVQWHEDGLSVYIAPPRLSSVLPGPCLVVGVLILPAFVMSMAAVGVWVFQADLPHALGITFAASILVYGVVWGSLRITRACRYARESAIIEVANGSLSIIAPREGVRLSWPREQVKEFVAYPAVPTGGTCGMTHVDITPVRGRRRRISITGRANGMGSDTESALRAALKVIRRLIHD